MGPGLPPVSCWPCWRHQPGEGLFEAAFTIDIRGRQGDRSVRPHFQTVRVRAVVTTGEPLEALAAVIAETEARCPVLNLLLDAKAGLRIEWLRDSRGTLEPVPRP